MTSCPLYKRSTVHAEISSGCALPKAQHWGLPQLPSFPQYQVHGPGISGSRLPSFAPAMSASSEYDTRAWEAQPAQLCTVATVLTPEACAALRQNKRELWRGGMIKSIGINLNQNHPGFPWQESLSVDAANRNMNQGNLTSGHKTWGIQCIRRSLTWLMLATDWTLVESKIAATQGGRWG